MRTYKVVDENKEWGDVTLSAGITTRKGAEMDQSHYDERYGINTKIRRELESERKYTFYEFKDALVQLACDDKLPIDLTQLESWHITKAMDRIAKAKEIATAAKLNVKPTQHGNIQ